VIAMASGFKNKIEMIMTGAGKGRSALEILLGGLSSLYSAGVRTRGRLYDNDRLCSNSLPIPVISVGNITVGGTGKTPLTVYLAHCLCEKGIKPAILSRGYGGNASEKGGVVSDGRQIFLDVSQAGDEPYMMAKALPTVPVLVGKNRYESGLIAISQFSPDLFLLDDGFQHRKLNRDLNILLLDSDKPFGNGYLLPRGTLREPVSAISRADMFVLTRATDLRHVNRFRDMLRTLNMDERVMNTPVFACSHTPVVCGILKANSHEFLSPDHIECDHNDVFAFSGIAKNKDFRQGLETSGFMIKDFMEFSDHHSYSPQDINHISSQAIASKARMMATTEKDMARFQDRVCFPMDILIVGVSLSFVSGEQDFLDVVLSKISPDRT
jgi:tetraacyldisaccharide 4'-kinase